MIDQSQEHDLVYSKDTSFYDPQQCLNKQSNALISPVVSLQQCVEKYQGKTEVNFDYITSKHFNT